MKYISSPQESHPGQVAPHPGAWIEIADQTDADRSKLSHPTRVRGLKCGCPTKTGSDKESHPTRVRGLKSLTCFSVVWSPRVAPHPGAWIEISAAPSRLRKRSVAPHPGAWIEIRLAATLIEVVRSHPTRVRGLKYTINKSGAPGSSRRTPPGCVD